MVEQSDGSFEVTANVGSESTKHHVTVPVELLGSLGYERRGATELVRDSFVFLLERETPSSILRRFSLDVISKYFPEYDEEMRRRAGAV